MCIRDRRDTLLQNIDILKKRLKSNGKLDEDKLTLLKSSAKRVQEIGPLIVQMSEEYDELEEEIESTQNGGRIVISEVAYPGVKMTIANVSSFIHNETKHSAFVRDGAEIRVRAIWSIRQVCFGEQHTMKRDTCGLLPAAGKDEWSLCH